MRNAVALSALQGPGPRAGRPWKQEQLWKPSSCLQAQDPPAIHSSRVSSLHGTPVLGGLAGRTDDRNPKSPAEAWLTGNAQGQHCGNSSQASERPPRYCGSCGHVAGTGACSWNWPLSPHLVPKGWEVFFVHCGLTGPSGFPLSALPQ